MRAQISSLLAGAAIACFASAAAAQTVQRFDEDHVIGTSLTVVTVARESLSGQLAHRAAKAEIARLDAVLSTWRDDSELSRLNASAERTPVSPDLFAVLSSAEAWRVRTGGAFSARLGAVEQAWRRGAQGGQVPKPQTISALAEQADHANVQLDHEALTVARSGAAFAIDGLAKGYILDAALAAARRAAPGLRGMLIDIGGDMRCFGQSPSEAGWMVGVAEPGAADNASPAQRLRLGDQAVATSGMGKRDLTISDCRYSHVLSPFDGQSVETKAVTVVAATAMDADALASAASVLPPHRALELISATPGAQAHIVGADGITYSSAGWARLLAPVVAKANVADCAAIPAAKPWPAGFTVDINYTIPEAQSGRSRPPFLVVWITDAKGQMVRTLFHLGDHPQRYLDSNYVWWDAFSQKSPDLLATVTRPSRRPGQYDVQWDGKDDDGRLVGQGAYVVNIEAAREHGGHSYQRIPLTLGDKPASGSGAASAELGDSTVVYGKPS